MYFSAVVCLEPPLYTVYKAEIAYRPFSDVVRPCSRHVAWTLAVSKQSNYHTNVLIIAG